MRAVLNWMKAHGLVHLAIAALFTLPMIGLVTFVPNNGAPILSKIRLWFDSFEYKTVDTRMSYGRKAKADPSLVLLAIDDASLDPNVLEDAMVQASPVLGEMKTSGFPFPRDVYAQACDRLFSAGAKVVAFDINFLNERPQDAVFRQALDKYREKVVIGLNFTDDGASYQLPSSGLLPSQDPNDERLGYFNFWVDPVDVLVRAAQYRNNNVYLQGIPGADKSPMLYSMAARLVQKDGHGDLVPNDFQPRPLRFTRGFPTFSFYKLFYDKSWAGDFQNGQYFRDKIVLVGPVGDWSKDSFSTPEGIIPGAELHLQAANALLQNDFLTPISTTFTIVILLLVALEALALAALVSSIAVRFGLAVLAVAVYLAVAMGAYNASGWLLPVMAPGVVFLGTFSTGFAYDFVIAQLERYRLRITFERYNSKNVVKYLLANPESYNEMLVGTHRDISVLFSDIRSFTTIVESAPNARELVRKLNEYLTAMVDCVIRHDGNLEKFMGDGIMAVWGNTPYSAGPKDDAIRAVRSALDMGVELKKLNAMWVSQGLSEWKIGVGVNHGNVIVGDMGSPDHKEFAMVGDAVNLGSRLEGLTKEFRVPVMLGEKIAALVDDVFYLRSVSLVKVKGKNIAVKAFTVLGEKKDGLPPEKLEFLQLYEDGIAAFRGRDFERALKLFNQALKLEPEDFLAGEYRRSAEHYIQEPPPEQWDGVTVMKEK